MKTLQGTVVSNRMVKTLVVRVDRLRQHSKYRKFYRVSRKFKVHTDDARSFNIGDVVRIQETRPFSKEKRWKVIAVVRQAPTEETGLPVKENSLGRDANFSEL